MTSVLKKTIFTALIMTSNHLYAESYDFKPGLWETSSTIEIIEIEASPEVEKMMRSIFTKSAEVETDCVNNFASVLEIEDEPEFECARKIKRVSAERVELEDLCSGNGVISKNVGRIDLNGKTLTSTYEMTMSGEGINYKLKTVEHGKYVGACN